MPPAPFENRPKRILIVDDEELLSWCISHELSTRGYEVCRARTVAEGVSALRSFRPDLVLCDQIFPDGKFTDGLRRARFEGGGIPMIFFTAYTPLTEPELRKAGARLCLSKTYVMENLLLLISESLNARPQDLALLPQGE